MATKGNCYLCGATLGKVAMQKHLLECNLRMTDFPTLQECRLLRIEGEDNRDYWLYIDMPANQTLAALDRFLRRIWLECCGHMSLFEDLPKSTRLSALGEGTRILHEYDMGSTTRTRITVLGTIQRPKQREVVRVLARNVPPKFQCAKCGSPAEYICPECAWETENAFYCEDCAETHEHDYFLPITNSPRMGVCGYCGEQDCYEFDPSWFQDDE